MNDVITLSVDEVEKLDAIISRNATAIPDNTIRVEFFPVCGVKGSELTEFGYKARLTQSQFRGHFEVAIGLNTLNPIMDIVEGLNKGGYAIQSVVEYEGMYYLGTNVLKPFNVLKLFK